MRSRGALLISLAVLVVVWCGTAAAAPPKQADRRQPGREGLLCVRGVMVKAEENGGRWVTLVATGFSGMIPERARDRLEPLTPFRVACGRQPIDYGLGHGLTVMCHPSAAEGAVPELDPDEIVGIAAAPQFGEKIVSTGKPDYDAMETILKESLSDEARLLTVQALITIPGKRSSRTLAVAINDIVEQIRVAAARELVARQYKPAVEKLSALLLRDIDDELGYQIQLAEILAEAGHEIGLQFLMRHVEDEDRGVVLRVLKALGNTGGAEQAARLRELAEASDDKGIAAAAREAAEEIEKRVEQ
jgi:hypothetical protein